MQRSEQIDQLAASLVKAQAKLPSAKKNATNPHFRSHYADLKAINEAASVIHEFGLSWVQGGEVRDGQFGIETTLLHISGQFISGFTPVIVGDTARSNGPQAWGSGITYARRYGLSALLGIAADEDDDGNSAQNHRSPAPKPEVRAEPNDILKVVQKQFDAKIVGVVTEGRKHWGEFVCPIGARKGQKLSEIPAKAVEWWYQNFEVNPKYPDSKEFRNALDDWKAEHELNKSKIKNDRIPVDETGRGAPDDDGNPVPF
jgi:hypothetical protein